MQPNGIVKCVRGFTGILEEGGYYTIAQVKESGHLLLHEVQPPSPYNCFSKDRFIEVQSGDEGSEIIEEALLVNIED